MLLVLVEQLARFETDTRAAALRAAKSLKYRDIAAVNYFTRLTGADQRRWKAVLQSRSRGCDPSDSNGGETHPATKAVPVAVGSRFLA